MKCLPLIFVFLGQYVETKLDVDFINKGLSSYYSVCPKNSCHTNITNEINSTFSLPDCLYCRCSMDCNKYGDCCPNVLIERPIRTCKNRTILLPNNRKAHSTFGYNYKMVNDCPVNATGEGVFNCIKKRDTTEMMTLPPVTSLVTHLTYTNAYCSQCHGESRNLEPWWLDTICRRTTDFNFLSSTLEIENLAVLKNCTLLYRYDNLVERCTLRPQVVINKCNQTGTQIIRNTAIDEACLYIDQPYGVYRNVFCYICNPLTGPLDEISTCSSDDQTGVSNLCQNSPSNDLTYPYKNQYCYRCNVDETTEAISDIHYDMNITGKGFIAYIFTSYCNEDFKLGTYDINKYSPVIHETEDTLPLRNNSGDTISQNMIYSRPWQYHVNCPQMEIFSKLYTVKQLKSQALKSRCIFQNSTDSPILKCFKKIQLIRKCNVEGRLNDINPLFEIGCLYLESEHLISYNGYYNVFCFMCNEYVLYGMCDSEYFTTVFDLQEIKCYTAEYGSLIHQIWCTRCSYSGGRGLGYRPMFTLSSYQESLTQLNNCYSNQFFDYRLNVCRDLLCSPGKVLNDRTCQPLLESTKDLTYVFTSGISVFKNDTSNVNDYLFYDFYKSVKKYFQKRLNNKDILFQMVHIISDTTCDASNFSGIFYLRFHFFKTVHRRHTEETLLSILYSTNAIHLGTLTVTFRRNNLAFYAPVIANNVAFSERCTYFHSSFYGIHTFKPSHVNDLLLCNQIELGEHEYRRDEHQQIQLHFNSYVLGPNDYLVVQKDKIRICADKYEQIMKIKEQNNLDSTVYVLSFICSAMSILCLASTFITYALFSVLRTIPGQNNMFLAFVLMLSEILIHVRLYEFNEKKICQILGVLSHYFLLSVFMSFNVCTFHVYRVFTCRVSKLSTGKNLRFKYILYSFVVPALIVTCNLITTYLAEGSIGYGGDSCFLILRTAAIVTLHCPIGIILLANTFMFIMAIRQISNSPNMSSESSTHEKRKDIMIFMKLFTITGCTWIFQFVDSFLPESIFSVLISFCNVLSGMYIFNSYIYNRRVLMLYKHKLLRRQEGNEIQSLRSTTALYRLSSDTSTISKN